MSEWIEWNGGECPVEIGTLVDLTCRNNSEYFGIDTADESGIASDWFHRGSSLDITAYRLHEKQPDNEAIKPTPDELIQSLKEVREKIKPLLEQEAGLIKQLKEVRDTIDAAIASDGYSETVDDLDGFTQIDPSEAKEGDYVVWDKFDPRNDYDAYGVVIGDLYRISAFNSMDMHLMFQVCDAYIPYTTPEAKFRTYRKMK